MSAEGPAAMFWAIQFLSFMQGLLTPDYPSHLPPPGKICLQDGHSWSLYHCVFCSTSVPCSHVDHLVGSVIEASFGPCPHHGSSA